MIIMIATALAVAPPAASAAPTDPHAQHQQQQQKGQKAEGCCCCKDMAKVDHKMEGGAKHCEGHGGEHAEHGATR